MKLSLVIPAHNEEGCLEDCLRPLAARLEKEAIPHELLVVNDHSSDGTEALLKKLQSEIRGLRYVNNLGEGGFGWAVRKGLEEFGGDVVAIVMADGSDSPEDVVRFYRELQAQDVGCVFGTRFSPESKVEGYPLFKLLLNRLVNHAISLMFGIRYNDVTNAFKMYRREVVQGLKPFLSCHFNLTVELPLKAIVRGFSFTIVPNSWKQRKHGVSKLKIKEMGSRYMFIILYCFIEKWLSRGDYRARQSAPDKRARLAG